MPNLNKKQKITPTPEITKKLQRLQGRFEGAIQFLKKTIINKQGKNVNLANLPWYLFIGPTAAGKTTLLANSSINFILAKQFKSDNATLPPPSDSCDFWVTRDLALLDVPGAWVLSKKENSTDSNSAYYFLWQHLLTLIKKTRNKKTLQGVILALHLPELIKQPHPHKKQFIIDIKKSILDLQEKFGKQLPIHLIITKCDLLPGFSEFFSDYSSEELAQTWGVSLSSLSGKEKLADAFSNRFNALIKRLNKQLLLRLHQERNPQARPYIKDFPLHIERLKESIAQFLKTLMIPDLAVQGVYLTSGTQDNLTEKTSEITHPNAFANQALQIIAAPSMPTHAYFVRQLILQNLSSSASYEGNPVRLDKWKRRIIYSASITTILIVSMILTHDFKQGTHETYAIQDALTHYQLNAEQTHSSSNRLMLALPLLNTLEKATQHSTYSLSSLLHVWTFYSTRSQQTASEMYHQALQTIVLPEIKNYFEKYLSSAVNKNPEQVYAVLKAYLMLNDPAHFELNYVNEIFHQLRQNNSMPEQTAAELNKHIEAALNNGPLHLTVDLQLIATSREQLLNQSNTSLGFILLKNMDHNNLDDPINLGTQFNNPPVFRMQSVASLIPTMFTAEKFPKVVDEINTAAAETLQGNWILGNISTAPLNQNEVNILASQLRSRYIANYVDIWESLIANIQIPPSQDLAQIDKLIATITGDNSPLLQLLNTIKENTVFSPIVTASPKLQSLSVLLIDIDNNKNGSLYEIFITLHQLHSYLQSILTAPNVAKKALEIASERLQHKTAPQDDPITQILSLAKQSPEPMKSWLNSIANQSWHFILEEAQA